MTSLIYFSQISECMELQAEVTHLKEQLSQALEAKDLLSNSMMQNNRGVNHAVERHADQGSAVPREVSMEPLQKQQQVCFLCSSFHFLYNCFLCSKRGLFPTTTKTALGIIGCMLKKKTTT